MWTELLNHLYKLEFMTRYSKEIINLTKIGIFSIIDMPLNLFYKDLLPLIWVFKYKTDSDDFIIKYKSRFVARGDLQIIEEEIYVATIVIQTFRAIITIYTAFDLNYKSYNVINIYINLVLRKLIYCQLFPRYEQSSKILRLLKALYRLKNAPNL